MSGTMVPLPMYLLIIVPALLRPSKVLICQAVHITMNGDWAGPCSIRATRRLLSMFDFGEQHKGALPKQRRAPKKHRVRAVSDGRRQRARMTACRETHAINRWLISLKACVLKRQEAGRRTCAQLQVWQKGVVCVGCRTMGGCA